MIACFFDNDTELLHSKTVLYDQYSTGGAFGSIVVIAIPNAHTQDDATDSLSLRSFYGKNYMLL